MVNTAPQRKDLVYLAMNFLTEQFNAWYTQNVAAAVSVTGEPAMKLSPVINQKGDLLLGKLAMTLTDISEDAVGKKQDPYRLKGAAPKDGYVMMNPEIKLNLHVLISAYGGGNYQEALKLISYVTLYFQSKHVFSSADYPVIQPIDTLILHMLNQDNRQSENLWTRIGAKYMPSILYRVKLLIVDGQQPIQDVAAGATQQVGLRKVK